ILTITLVVSHPLAQPVAAIQTAPRRFVTKRTGVFNGQRINYVATVGETILKDEAGAATASLFSTSYVREDVKDKARRPVIFAFNGGPGASSAFPDRALAGHEGLFFPRRPHRRDCAAVQACGQQLRVIGCG